jgi:DNA-binding NtrC family response regulator
MDEAGFMAALEKNALGPLKIVKIQEGEKDGPEPVLAQEPQLDPEEDRPDNEESGFDLALGQEQNGLPLMTIDEMERRLIGKALSETSGNRTHAAKLLGISVRTLRNKLAEYRTLAPESLAAHG